MQWRDRGPTNAWLQDFLKDLYDYGFMSARDILFCLFLGVVFTILRYILTVAIFKVRLHFISFMVTTKCNQFCVSNCFTGRVKVVELFEA